MTEAPPTFDRSLRTALLAVAGIAAFFTLMSFVFWSPRAGLGVLVGGTIATLNLAALARIVVAFLARGHSAVLWSVLAALKIGVLAAIVYLLMKGDRISGLHLALGYASLPAGILLGSLAGPAPEGDAPEA